ncbi:MULTISPECIES: dipeptidase [Bacillus]|uniref:dipeptidase n=1 Tax=Bacillus TaxID=1386 RepID=UPI000BB9A5A3|nr:MULTISPECIES: dipeptidase [Bacillus]
MKIFDAHSDVLYKMYLDRKINFKDSPKLHITYDQLKHSKAKVQSFALYVPENELNRAFEVTIEMIDIFYQKILKNFPKMRLVTSQEDIQNLKDDEIGAMLSLEGCEAIGISLEKLRTFYRLGVTSIGLTWNHANLVGDGVLEKRNAGLTSFGKEVVIQNNLANVWTDVSHLSETGFWEVMDIGEMVIASHSNVKLLCDHPRNLSDEQINAIIKKDGVIGITFVPQFLVQHGKATITDALKHLEHICSLGGEKHVGFGSDFDGIDETVVGLENYSKYSDLINMLQKYYSETQVNNFLFNNFVRKYHKQ